MTINFAVERLYETGWLPASGVQLEKLPNGLRYPSVSAVHKLFDEAGASLSLKPHLMFGCWRAEWTSVNTGDEITGTVVGSSEAEAAVYALANLREQQANLIFSVADSV
jgi:hypothetical protein